MWNRREAESSSEGANRGRAIPANPSPEFTAAPLRSAAYPNGGIVNIGQSICIRGELTGNEDLTIEGKVEGKIDLQEHNLTIGPNGRIQAEVRAQIVVIQGEVTGNIQARERLELADTGKVNGDIMAPRIVIADGARFKGSVDMSGGSTSAEKETSEAKPAVITDGSAEAARGAARP